MALALMFQAFYLALFPSDTFAATPPKVNAPIALAVDATSGRILYAKDANRRIAMASTTKIMTALTAMSVPGVNLNEKYTVVKSDLVGEAAMGLLEGDVVTFQDLLFGMLINSGNDAATAIARYAGSKLPGQGDPVARFVQQMNTKANEYGLRNTHYANPHGLDQAGHYSSAFDLAITGWYLLKDPLLSQIVQVQSAVRAGKNLQTLNRFLKNYQGATGIKPGETDNAGLCLVGSATRNNKTVITVILGANLAGYNNDPITLSDFAFAELNSPTLAAGGGTSKAEYIGKVSDNKLIVDQIANVGGNPLQVIGNNPEVLNAPINAQVVTTVSVATPTPTFQQSNGSLITVRPDASSNQTESPQNNTTPGGSDNDSSKKKDAGVSLPLILFVILVILGGIWLAARMGYIAGDRGRDMAYTVQDGVVAGAGWFWHWSRKLLVQLKPGHHDEEPKSRELPKGVPAQANRLQSNNYRTRVQATPTRPATRNESRPVVEDNYPSPENVSRRPSGGEYTITDNTRPTAQRPNMAQPIGRSPVVPNNPTKPNPLDNFFDDVPPFQVDPHSEPQVDSSLRPPAPLGLPRPTAYQNHPNRTAAEPQQAPEDPYKARIPAPLSSAPVRPNPAPAPVNNNNPPVPNGWGAENITMRARQAIDYAYAGRLQASTDEFRKVIETNPLFDFGSIDEFEQMPVMGFKALATAYHTVGKTKYAMLLLDLAVEKYPNDLELRNLFRSMRREMGA
jgi:D-alanyl-D-alanine carboxypeptidase